MTNYGFQVEFTVFYQNEFNVADRGSKVEDWKKSAKDNHGCEKK